jgi:hypothetical protein
MSLLFSFRRLRYAAYSDTRSLNGEVPPGTTISHQNSSAAVGPPLGESYERNCALQHGSSRYA